MGFYIILLVISVTLTLNAGANNIGFPRENENYDDVKVRHVEEAYMLCVNGSKYEQEYIDEDELDLIFLHRPIFTYCDKRLSYRRICHLLEEYKNCSFNLVEYKRIPSRNMDFRFEKHLIVTDPAQPIYHYEEYPIFLEKIKDYQKQSSNITAIDYKIDYPGYSNLGGPINLIDINYSGEMNPSEFWRAKMEEIANKDASIEKIEADENKHNRTKSETNEKVHNATTSEIREQLINSSSLDQINQSKPWRAKMKKIATKEDNITNIDESARIRKSRQIQYCRYPTNLKTSDVICRRYPSKMRCVQKCIFGYTLKEGITRKMECIFSENKWNPIGFEECRPFLDCTMTLISSGELSCFTPTTKIAPSCNVTCDAYEDKPATSQETYECRISGAWSRKLPFCVVPGSGLDLVPAPRIKLHPIEDKPEQKKKHFKQKDRHLKL